MASTIRIKRRASGNAGAPVSLANAELAYNEVDDVLYYGKGTGGAGGTATTIPAIGGPGAFVTLATNQTISGSKEFTGVITVPTKSVGDNGNNAASTKYVDDSIATVQSTFTVAGNSGSFTFKTGSTLTIQGDGSILSAAATQPSGNNVTLSFAVANSSIGNAKLVNSSVTIGSTAISLGSSSTILDGLTSLSGSSGLTIYSGGTNGNITLSPSGSGYVDASNKRITNVASPTSDSDAVNKIYVDNAISGLSWKQSINLIATSNISLTGGTDTLVIDGHSALNSSNNGYRLLLTNQVTGSENGIYVYSDNGTTYSLTRSADADVYTELKGASVYVIEGTTYKATGWVQSNHYITSFAGQQWVQFSGSATYSAGNGLTLTGSTFDVVGTANRITVNADSIDISSSYAGQSTITTLGTITSGTWTASTIGVGYGGTGATTLTSKGILYGNGTSAIGVTAAAGTSDQNTSYQILTVNGSGTPIWASALDGGTF